MHYIDTDDYYHTAKPERKPSGVILMDGKEIASTLQCPHCKDHFISRKGSGITRGFCSLCMGVVCGKMGCFAHPLKERFA